MTQSSERVSAIAIAKTNEMPRAERLAVLSGNLHLLGWIVAVETWQDGTASINAVRSPDAPRLSTEKLEAALSNGEPGKLLEGCEVGIESIPKTPFVNYQGSVDGLFNIAGRLLSAEILSLTEAPAL